MKRGIILISIISILLLQIVLATQVTYTYTTVSDNINAIVYKKLDNTKLGLTHNSGSTNQISIDYPDNPSNYNTYHYKQGYLPYQLTTPFSLSLNYPIKQSNCKTPIKSVSIPPSANQNQQFTIIVNLGSITDVFSQIDPFPSFIPFELEEYYKADTTVKLYINNQPTPIDIKTIKISTIGNSLQFTPSISTTGNINIKITTDVTDDQCSNYNPDEYLGQIQINALQQQCPICSLPTSWTTCINSKQNRTNYKCDSSTSYQCQSYIETQLCSLSQTCIEAWECSEWSPCTNLQQTKTCIDTNNCGTTLNKPVLSQTCLVEENQPCTENWVCAPEWSQCINGQQTKECDDSNGCSPSKIENNSCENGIINQERQKSKAVQEFNEQANTTVNLMLGKIAEGIQELISSNKYYFITSFVIIILIIALIIFYVGAHKEKILKPRTKIIKSDKKPVKVNDLMINVIDSLEADERELCYALLENEGITQEELMNKTSLTKTKIEIALTKLERRQVIKKRDGDNPRLYFNDWLK